MLYTHYNLAGSHKVKAKTGFIPGGLKQEETLVGSTSKMVPPTTPFPSISGGGNEDFAFEPESDFEPQTNNNPVWPLLQILYPIC